MEKQYNPNIHHRRSIRFFDYDYSQDGLYFITICVQNKECLFGEIVGEEMILNEMGQIANDEWLKTGELRKNVQLHDFVLMPNHFHAIVEITNNAVGARRALPHDQNDVTPSVGARRALPLQAKQSRFQNQGKNTLSSIVGSYKSAVSRQLGFPVWQRNYYEHIIRDCNDYARIADYINNNPARWDTDCLR